METVECDLCGSKEYKVLFCQTDLLHRATTETFQMVVCENCRLHYLNPRPTQSEIMRYYPDKSGQYVFHNPRNILRNETKNLILSLSNNAYFTEAWSFKKALSKIILFPIYLPKLRSKTASILVPRIKSYLEINEPKRILDIGCGSGESTHMYGSKESIVRLASIGWKVYGVEPSDKARSILHNRGLKNIFADLFDTSLEEDFFDVIRMNWSLEHVHEPTSYLTECRRVLKANGKLIVSLPNYNGICYKIFPQCVEVPVHLYYFCVNTLKKYSAKLELKIVDYYTFSYVSLFLKCLELMGYSSIYQDLVDNPRKAIKLQGFLNVMSGLELGDDMVFCLTKS